MHATVLKTTAGVSPIQGVIQPCSSERNRVRELQPQKKQTARNAVFWK
jgi:hypothetical protein